MALTDNDIISRSNNQAIEIPTQVASDVLKQTAAESVVFRLAKRVNMGSKQYRQPQIESLPDAFWVSGDTGLKQMTNVKFGGKTLTAEPLATLVIVPDEFIDDSMVPIWSEVQPLIAQAFGRKVDNAALFGVNKPASWGQSVYQSAVAAGNTVERPTADAPDFGVDLANAAKLVSQDGFAVNAFATRPGLNWELLGQRDLNGGPIFTQLAGETGNVDDFIYGKLAVESRNGAWDADVYAIAGDWNNAVLGIRQDMTFTMHTDAVITDAAGAVQFNAMQQDSKIMRVVMRVGFEVTNPVTALNSTASRSPFALVSVAGTAGS